LKPLEDDLPLGSRDTIDMEYIYVITGFLSISFAIAGLVLTCYLERRWLNSRKTGSDRASRHECRMLEAERTSI
jgi:hypothetical protein